MSRFLLAEIKVAHVFKKWSTSYSPYYTFELNSVVVYKSLPVIWRLEVQHTFLASEQERLNLRGEGISSVNGKLVKGKNGIC